MPWISWPLAATLSNIFNCFCMDDLNASILLMSVWADIKHAFLFIFDCFVACKSVVMHGFLAPLMKGLLNNIFPKLYLIVEYWYVLDIRIDPWRSCRSSNNSLVRVFDSQRSQARFSATLTSVSTTLWLLNTRKMEHWQREGGKGRIVVFHWYLPRGWRDYYLFAFIMCWCHLFFNAPTERESSTFFSAH